MARDTHSCTSSLMIGGVRRHRLGRRAWVPASFDRVASVPTRRGSRTHRVRRKLAGRWSEETKRNAGGTPHRSVVVPYLRATSADTSHHRGLHRSSPRSNWRPKRDATGDDSPPRRRCPSLIAGGAHVVRRLPDSPTRRVPARGGRGVGQVTEQQEGAARSSAPCPWWTAWRSGRSGQAARSVGLPGRVRVQADTGSRPSSVTPAESATPPWPPSSPSPPSPSAASASSVAVAVAMRCCSGLIERSRPRSRK